MNIFKKYTIAAAISILGVAPVFAQTADKQAVASEVNKNAAEFKFEVEEYNFGSIKQGESITYTFNFTNVGKEPLIITDASATCGCTIPEWSKESIKKGEKGSIKVTFNSTGKMGLQDKPVTIYSNAKTPQTIVRLKGNVEQPVQQEPAK